MWKDIAAVIASPVGALLSMFVMGPRYIIGLEYGLVLAAMGAFFYFGLFFLFKDAGMFTEFGSNLRIKYNIDNQSLDIISHSLAIIVRGTITFIIATIISCSTCPSRHLHILTEAYAWFDLTYFFYDIWSIHRMTQQYGNGFLSFVRTNVYSFIRKFLVHAYFFFIIVFYRKIFGDCVLGLSFYKDIWIIFDGIRSILIQNKSNRHLLRGTGVALKLFTSLLLNCIMILTALQIYPTNGIHLDNEEEVNEMNTYTFLGMISYILSGIWIFGMRVYYYLKHEVLEF